ncbi:MAG: response regulator [Chitinophagaceae bacterium]|nr:response regulator [Chitinophagaceae bacterium]
MNLHTVELLLAEDNEHDAELTIRELKKHHMANNMVHVRDGEAALDFIYGRGNYAERKNGGQPPKVILLDIQMPKVNGLEVLKQVKSDPLTQAIPVVILTSSKEHPDVKRCYELGANSYIVKPVNFEGFAESIRNLGLYWLLLNHSPDKYNP